jgi:hypothetical protein
MSRDENGLLKLKVTLILLFIGCLNLVVFKLEAQTTMFSANPLRKNKTCLFIRYSQLEISEKYDWNTGVWNDLSKDQHSTKMMYMPMLGYGLSDKFSLFVQLPLYKRNKNHKKNIYFNEILLMSRYALFPASGKKTGLSLIGAVKFPTASAKDNPYSDGSVDFIIGEIFSTKWYGKWRSHLKSEYIINTKNDKSEIAGNELKIALK